MTQQFGRSSGAARLIEWVGGVTEIEVKAGLGLAVSALVLDRCESVRDEPLETVKQDTLITLSTLPGGNKTADREFMHGFHRCANSL